MESNLKQCSTCKLFLARCEFRRDKYNPDGLMYHCKKCKTIKDAEYHKKNPHIRKETNERNKDKRKEYYSNPERKRKYKHEELLRTYNITIEQYEQMLTDCNHVCSICKRPERSKLNTKLSIDHCHKTGIIRGLLCSHCNRGIGFFEDDVERIKNVITYLTKDKINEM